MVESRFKAGDVVRCVTDGIQDGPTMPVRVVTGYENGMVRGTFPAYSETAWWRINEDELRLVSRRDWIDPNEWLMGLGKPSASDAAVSRLVANLRTWEVLAWGFFCGWAASHATFAVGSGSWKKPEELVAVSMRRGLAEKIGTNWLSTDEHGELWAACRAALDAEASR